MAVTTTTAPRTTLPAHGRLAVDAGTRTIARILRSLHGVWDGSSFEPGRHSLTRVQDPGERQIPR